MEKKQTIGRWERQQVKDEKWSAYLIRKNEK